MQDLVESTWRWRDAGTPMRRRRRIVSAEIMEFLDFSPVSPRPRKTLKGVPLRANLQRLQRHHLVAHHDGRPQPASLTRVRCIGVLIERKFFCDKGLTFKQRKSPMPTQCNPDLFAFAPAEGRPVVVSFEGGAITSDAGALLLGATDRVLGLTRRLAACFKDSRDPAYTEHALETLVMQRVVGIALGYEDLNDHDQIRHDPVLAALANKLTASRSDCAPLAGKSTLNRLELSRDA